MTEPSIIPLTRLDLHFEPAPWPFADDRRSEIDAHFAKLRAAKPLMWNGRVLLLRRGEIAGDVLSGSFTNVGIQSSAEKISFLTVPGSMWPGQRMTAGARMPPSQVVSLPPAKGVLPPSG